MSTTFRYVKPGHWVQVYNGAPPWSSRSARTWVQVTEVYTHGFGGRSRSGCWYTWHTNYTVPGSHRITKP